MGSALRFPPYDDTHVLSVNAELSQDKILRDREILTVTAIMQKLGQSLPLVAGHGPRADAVILVSVPIDVAIYQANLLLVPEVCAFQQDTSKTLEPPRACLLVAQALVNCFKLGFVGPGYPAKRANWRRARKSLRRSRMNTSSGSVRR